MAPALAGAPSKVKRVVQSHPAVVSHVQSHSVVPHPAVVPHVQPHPVMQQDTLHTDNKAYLALGLGAIIGLGVAYFKD